MRGLAAKAKHIDYYPTIEDIFKELYRQSNTKMSIQVIAKKTNQPIVEPLTEQEKEEDYEVQLHISTFTSEDSLAEEKNTLQIVTVSQPQQALVLTKPQEEEGEQTDKETQSDKPEYALTK